MADASYGSLPFREQAEFFRRKVNVPTTGWTDIYGTEQEWAFTVAGANRDAIVTDFRQAVQKAIDGETTYEGFARDFDRIVATHGWDYHGSRGWRSRLIYDQNLTNSYAAGRYEQLQDAPYWQYVHQDWVEHPRPLHQAWNGLILERGNPWLTTHYPPNGWGCHCEMRGLWPRDLARMGKSGPDQAPEVKYEERTIGARSELGPRTVRVPEGVDPGFDYAPGAQRLRNSIPPALPAPADGPAAGVPGVPNRRPSEPLPLPRPMPADSLPPAGLEPTQYVEEFLDRLGVSGGQPAIVRDPIGERVVVGRELFTAPQGVLSASQAGREQLLPLLADALLSPDEIWVRLEWQQARQRAAVRRTYLARFLVEGQSEPTLVVFELGQDGWVGLTRQGQNLDDWRLGARLYRRVEDDESAAQ